MKKARIIENKCRGCGCCVRSCPMNNITLGKKKAESGDECNGCEKCIKACPFDAIELNYGGN
ncbi:MAG: 4Fe-4S dicluster domain-containing protein [Ruminococcaceae bacterium]|nr:4Fe-4S dicluster domain-containing protein [Oscillospiraceae bacterium]